MLYAITFLIYLALHLILKAVCCELSSHEEDNDGFKKFSTATIVHQPVKINRHETQHSNEYPLQPTNIICHNPVDRTKTHSPVFVYHILMRQVTQRDSAAPDSIFCVKSVLFNSE